MKLSAKFMLLAALAVPTVKPALAAGEPAVQRLATVSEIAQFFNERQDRAFWFGPDKAAETLLTLIEQSALDDLDASNYPVATMRRLAASARSGSARDRREAEAAFSEIFVRYAADVARERNVGTLYVDPGARPRPVSAARLLRVAAAAPSLGDYVKQMGWMHPYYSALRNALAEEKAGANQPRRIRLFTLNRDRARVLPRGSGDYILVNSAAARLDFYAKGKVKDTMRVVVGEAAQQTPMMAGMVRYAILNPYWHVPTDLAQTRLAPRVVSEGLIYLRKKGYEVVSEWSNTAKVIPIESIDWKAVAAGKLEVKVRQRPGPTNGMGEIKFMFPNDLGIYLHDTPGKTLFQKSERTFSAGCVRLEDAQGLKNLILGDTPMASSTKPEQYVPLSRPVPVFLAYLTAYPQDGKIVERPDVYKRDAKDFATTIGGSRAAR
ncbi:MAG: L,D-transpeptidase family protein [Pseudomonadota bacterium]